MRDKSIVVKEYGYEYDAALDAALDAETADSCVFVDGAAYLLRSGRDALKSVAREYNDAVVFLPALSCDSMRLPFEAYGHKIVYYRLKDDYSLDFDNLIERFHQETKQILFLYMDYFGKLSVSDSSLKSLKQQFNDAVFIEDRTHDLLYPRQNEFLPDYTVASLRKWLNIPDGGILWTDKQINTDFSESTAFSKERRYAQNLRRKYFECGDESLKTRYRKVFSTVTDQIDSELIPGKMSAYAYKMAKSADFKEIRRIREKNTSVLLRLFGENDRIKLIQTDAAKSNLYVPILIENRDEIQRKLSAKGIFTTLIWPLSYEQKTACRVADYTERHMLSVPCDQRYNEADMDYIGREIIKAIMESRA